MPKITDEEVEAMMVPQVAAAIYPVLFPVEEQDMRSQQRNSDLVNELAKEVWRGFKTAEWRRRNLGK